MLTTSTRSNGRASNASTPPPFVRQITCPGEVGAAVVRRDDHLLVGAAPSRVVAADGAAALTAIDNLEPGFWVGACSFELGHALERVPVTGACREGAAVPDVLFARFDALAAVAPSGAVGLW